MRWLPPVRGTPDAGREPLATPLARVAAPELELASATLILLVASVGLPSVARR